MNDDTDLGVEADPRFPSGPWTGFFLQKEIPGKHRMELRLTFRGGSMTGEGRDRIGEFVIRGQYHLADGKCHWNKRYLKAHDVFYQGYNEGKGIWGVWELEILGIRGRGGFHIWPEGMGDPSIDHLVEEADVPVEEDEEAGILVLPGKEKP
jgi:hypothetical protein